MTMNNQPPEDLPRPSIPHSREAEEAVIGAILINPDLFLELHFLQPADFYIHKHRWIWEAFTSIDERRTPIDNLTLADELDKQGRLAEIGGPAYVTALINQVPTSMNAVHYGKIVSAHSTRRKMITAANTIAQLAYDITKDTEELEAEANHALIKATGRITPEGEEIGQVMARIYAQVDENTKARKAGLPIQLGIPTGYIDLDKLVQGLKKKRLILVAGRPGMGKSSLMINIARQIALVEKKKIAVFSPEMTNDEIGVSFASQHASIDGQRIEAGALEPDQWAAFTHAVESMSGTNIYLDDSAVLTPAALRAKCLKRKMRYGIDLVIVDYLQLMSAGVKQGNREQEIAYISRGLKVLAGELQCPVLAGCQLSRAVEQRASKRPVLSDLRESGALEQDADIVMFVHRPDQYDKKATPNVTELIIAKHRKGPLGMIELVFRPSFVKFENAATKQVEFDPDPQTLFGDDS